MTSRIAFNANDRSLGIPHRVRRRLGVTAILFLLTASLARPASGQLFARPDQQALWTQDPSPPTLVPGQSQGPPFRPGQAGPFASGSPYAQSPPGTPGRCPDCGAPGPGSASDSWHPGERLREGLSRLLQPEGRYRGPGQPLLRESWRYRPFSAGWFMGALQGSTLVDDWAGQKGGYLGGYRFGWDFDHYWGCEGRFAWGYAELNDSQRAKDAQKAADDAKGLAPDDPFRQRFDTLRDNDITCLCDFSFLYYPWGDSAWRPYLLAGIGYGRIDFEDRLSQYWQAGMLEIPLGIGFKYRWNDWLALRVELTDNVLLKNKGIKTLHEMSLTGGVEIRFGGTRKAYWPWNPSRSYW